MKYTPNQSITKFLLFLIIALALLHVVCGRKTDLYSKNGRDWTGVCSIGKFQSPINIIEGINTIEDRNHFN